MNKKLFSAIFLIAFLASFLQMSVAIGASILTPDQLSEAQRIASAHGTTISAADVSSGKVSVGLYGGVPVSIIIGGSAGAANSSVPISAKDYTFGDLKNLSAKYKSDGQSGIANDLVASTALKNMGILNSVGAWASVYSNDVLNQISQIANNHGKTLSDTDSMSRISAISAYSNYTYTHTPSDPNDPNFSGVGMIKTISIDGSNILLDQNDYNPQQLIALKHDGKDASSYNSNANYKANLQNMGFIPPPAFSAACSASPSTVNTGGSLTWTATAAGGFGDGTYTYLWGGSTSGGTTQSIPATYSTPDTYNESVTITSTSPGSSGVSTSSTANCSIVVKDPPPVSTSPASGGSGGSSGTYTASGLVVVCQGPPAGECGYNDFINEVKLLLNFAFIISVPITLIFVTWTGIQILLSQGNEGKIKEAKERAMKVLIGFIFILTAWLIVYTIVHYFLQPKYYQQFISGPAASST